MSDNHTHTIHCDDESKSANLRIEKSVDNHTPQIGENVIWTIKIQNDGPGNATSVRVEDLLPEGVYHVSDNASFGEYDERTGEWYIGNFGPGVCHTLTIETTVTDTENAQVNSATISTNTHETDYTDNSDNDWIHATGDISDLNVTKTVSDEQPAIGDTVSWTVTIANDGPNAAQNVVVKDSLPSGVTFVSDSVTKGEFDDSASTWKVGQLNSGESQTLTIVTTVDESTAQWNSATANSDTYEADWSDNTGHAVVRGGEADLSITKSVSNTTPNLGEQVEWTIVVSNNGSDKAIGVQVKDMLPGGLQHLGDEASIGYFDEYQGQWWIGELEAGASETLTIQTNVVDAAVAQINTSTVLSDTSDTNTENNTATASTDAESADLSVVKTVSDEEPNVGDTITWTVVVTNEGVDTAINTVLHDALPNGVVFDAADATTGAYDDNTGQWALGDLASGASETLTIDTVVTDSFLQMNVAVVTSDTFDPDDCNNTDFAITDALPAADLAVTKVVSDEVPNLGDIITWTIEVSNNGPDAASNVEIKDILPEGVTFRPNAASNERSAGGYDPAEGSWTLSTLAVGATEKLVLTTKVESLDLQINTATVTSDTPDFNPDNNVDDAITDAVAADLAVTKVSSDEAPNLGDIINWTIEVTNNGPDAAKNIEIADILPDGVTFIPLELGRAGSAGTYNNAEGTWTLDSLAVGDSEQLILTTRVDSLDLQVNTATVTSETVDTNPDNNTDDAITDAVAADLAVTKTVSDEAPNLGDIITWTIELTNNGPDTATDIEILEILPAGVTFRPNAGTNETSAGTYTNKDGSWALDSLAVGATETLVLTTLVESLDVQVNTATVTSSTVDLVPGNNRDDATADPVGVDLQITKLVSDEAPSLGDLITWTLEVTNLGPDAATEVAVVDALPTGVTFESATTATGTAMAADGVLNWQIGDLAINTPVTLEIVTEVTSLDIQVNEATVTASPGEELDTSNNTAEDQTDAIQVDLSVTNAADVEVAMSGDTVVWTVTASNDGPDLATGVVLDDLLPEGVVFDSAETAAGTFTDGVWTIGDLASGETVTVSLTTTVSDDASFGELISIAEVIKQDQDDLDSAPDNDDGDQSEDDEAAASITVEAGFAAVPLVVEGSGDKSVNAVVVIDRSSSMKVEVGEPDADGYTRNRLDWNIDAVEEFAARSEVKAIKVIAFDGRVTDGDGAGGEIIYSGLEARPDKDLDKNHVPDDEVSEWFDLSQPGSTEALKEFLLELGPSQYFADEVAEVASPAYGSGTNYQAAIDATMAAPIDAPNTGALETNYYFFSDGEPTSGGDTANHYLAGENNEQAWQQFAEANFDNTFAVGYAGATTARTALEQIAHITGKPDDPNVDDDPNLLLVEEVDAVPSVLSNFASASVSGNAIANDMSDNPISITNMTFDGIEYSYAGGVISAAGATDATLTESFILVESAQGGSLQFDFETGDFTYFAPPNFAAEVVETFDYTIQDTTGMEASSTVTMKITEPPANAVNMVADDLTVADFISQEDDHMDQFLPSSTAPAKTPLTVSEVEAHAGLEHQLTHLDSELQILESGIIMY